MVINRDHFKLLLLITRSRVAFCIGMSVMIHIIMISQVIHRYMRIYFIKYKAEIVPTIRC